MSNSRTTVQNDDEAPRATGRSGSKELEHDGPGPGNQIGPVWKARPMKYRILLVVGLWAAYFTVVATDAVYADSIGMFINISTSTLIHDVVPVQYVIILQTMVGVWQLFFLVYNSIATLSKFNLTEMPLPVLPMYTAALIVNLAVTLSMYLRSDLAVILISSTTSGILNVSAAFSIRATYKSPIPILPLCCYNPQVLYSTFMVYTVLYTLCHYAIALGYNAQTVNLIIVSTFLSTIVILIGVDVIVLDKWMQRTWSPYISSIISCVYLIVHNWDKGDFTVYLFVPCVAVISVAWIIKLVRSAQLTFEKPFRRCAEKRKRRTCVEDGAYVVENGELNARTDQPKV